MCLQRLRLKRLPARSRAFLKIQDGCNSHCAYCIVPSVRGPSRSLPAAQVIDRMRDLVANGYLEIVFTGIHLGLWGLDLNPSCCLSQLLTRCEADTALRGIRFRLSSLEPNEWSDDIIDLMLRSKKLCPHAHIPLQSGDADILHAMGRTYSPEFFHDLVLRLSREIPSINIGIDVIAGLPGETDACFEQYVQPAFVTSSRVSACISLFTAAGNTGCADAGAGAGRGHTRAHAHPAPAV